jgi:hypothetical protein
MRYATELTEKEREEFFGQHAGRQAAASILRLASFRGTTDRSWTPMGSTQSRQTIAGVFCRNYFARAPGSDLWVELGDIPEPVREALWARVWGEPDRWDDVLPFVDEPL